MKPSLIRKPPARAIASRNGTAQWCSSRTSAAAESLGMSSSTSQASCSENTCTPSAAASAPAMAPSSAPSSPSMPSPIRAPILLPSSMASSVDRLLRCSTSRFPSASLYTARESITRTRSLSRSRSSSAMISPWKSGWLNPSTMSCTGPIAIFLPLSPDRLAFVTPPLLWPARHGSSRSRPLLRQDPAVPAVAHHPPGVVHVAACASCPANLAHHPGQMRRWLRARGMISRTRCGQPEPGRTVVTMPPDPAAILRSNSYLGLLVLAAIIGVPVSAVAYFFLALVTKLQGWIFTSLPDGLGFHGEPLWWPVLPLTLAGVLVAATIRYLPGTGGHSPADGFPAGGGAPTPAELPGVVLAALATLCLGVVLGPEAPLIAIGGGLGVIAVRLARRPVPERVSAVVAAAGSFAAISTLLGSPLIGAFLLMEASGLAGVTLELVLLPGLVAAGVGSLIFIGLGDRTGLGTFSLALPNLPHVATPNLAEFGWALVIGTAAALLGSGI